MSEESLSGNEMDKMRKRMRTNTKRIQKRKRKVVHPQPGPKQDDLAGTENEIMDSKPLFGPTGSTTPDIPVPSGTISDPHKLPGASEFQSVLSDTALQSGTLSSRFSRIQKRVKRTGDGTHATWGWGDVDQPKEEIEDALITHKKSE